MNITDIEKMNNRVLTDEYLNRWSVGAMVNEVDNLLEAVTELLEYKSDIENATKSAMDEKCTLNEQHCTCVPLLRARIRGLELAWGFEKHFREIFQKQKHALIEIAEYFAGELQADCQHMCTPNDPNECWDCKHLRKLDAIKNHKMEGENEI